MQKIQNTGTDTQKLSKTSITTWKTYEHNLLPVMHYMDININYINY